MTLFMDLVLLKINVTLLLRRREQLFQWRVITTEDWILDNLSVRKSFLGVKLIQTNKLLKFVVSLIIFITLEGLTNAVGFYNIRI